MERNAHKEPQNQPNNPFHGKTLEAILVYLVSYYGWEELGDIIRINSFRNNPSLKSSLKFLRRTPWAREKVEQLYVETIEKK
ncbi:MAG TPA: VF530 family protein [Draconibacterium sp.]|nr:VF530 family protein [Draconibacterium sp.]